MLKGAIVSNELETIPNFKVYYQGTQTVSNDDGFFTLPLEDDTVQDLSLLICKDFSPKFEGTNTIKNLSVNPKKSYAYFALSKATLPLTKNRIDQLEQKTKPLTLRADLIKRQIERQKKHLALSKNKNRKKSFYRPEYYKNNLKKLEQRLSITTQTYKKVHQEILELKEKLLTFQNATPTKPAGDFWFIDKKILQNTVVPENCVIVSLNPKTVDRIENWSFSLSQNFMAFPKIILKENLETRNVKKKQSITRSALKSEFYALEKKVFHEQQKEVTKYFDDRPNVRVAILQKQ